MRGEPMKPATKRLAGSVVELERRADLLDAPGAQHDDAVGQRHRLDLVVGDVDHRAAELARAAPRSRCASRRAARRRGSTAARRTGRSSARARWRGRSRRAGAGRPRAPSACARDSRVELQHVGGAARPRLSISARWQSHVLEAERHVLVARSCAGRAHRTGTPWRARGRTPGRSLTRSPSMRMSPPRDLSPGRR